MSLSPLLRRILNGGNTFAYLTSTWRLQPHETMLSLLQLLILMFLLACAYELGGMSS